MSESTGEGREPFPHPTTGLMPQQYSEAQVRRVSSVEGPFFPLYVDASSMGAWIEAAPDPPWHEGPGWDDSAYENCARWYARALMHRSLATGRMVDDLVEIWEDLVRDGPIADPPNPSVLQWAWAVDTVRWLCELPPMPPLASPVIGDMQDFCDVVNRVYPEIASGANEPPP